ncbi:MAG: type II secretion system protein [Dehalococcoidales bacterium]|nr:type II secretion system protein [Dehalococcoidales bacterium]
MVKRRLRLLQVQNGFTLLETLVALGIFAVIGVAFMTFMSTAYKGVGTLDEQSQAEALARSQLEQIKSLPYQDAGNYSVTVSLPPQYFMAINVTSPTQIGTADNYTSLNQLMGYNVTTIQEITVSVFRPAGSSNRTVFNLSAYKSKVQ